MSVSTQRRPRRLWRWRTGNRRVAAPRLPVTAAALPSAPQGPQPQPGVASTSCGGAKRSRPPRVDWRALGRTVLRGAWRSARLVALAALITGLGAAGYYGYRGLTGSSTFAVRAIEIEGARPAIRAELLRTLEPLRGGPILRVATRELARVLAGHPWIAEAEVYRALPDTLHVVVRERQARAAALLGELYLLDATGWPFKRATLDEVAGLTVITGISREAFRRQPRRAAQRLAEGIDLLARYGRGPQRPPLGELHLDEQGEVTLFLRRGGTALRVGTGLDDAQLARLDRVWRALGADAQRAQTVFLDHRQRPGRVVVRMRQAD